MRRLFLAWRCLGLLLLLLAAGWPGIATAFDLAAMRFERLLNGDLAEHRGGIGMVNDIVQDQRGFIWVAGEHGAARYDAHEFRFYFPDPHDPNSIASNAIYQIVRDHHGDLWFATSNGLSRYNWRQDDFTTFRHQPGNEASISGNMVTQIAVRSDNTLVIATDRGLNFLGPDRQNFRHWRHDPTDPSTLQSDIVRAVFVDSHARLWVGYGDGGISLLVGGDNNFRHWQHDGSSGSLARHQIYAFEEDREGNLWIGTDGGGLSRLHTDLAGFTNYNTQAPLPRRLTSNVVRDISRDHSGQLWIALDHGGLGRYNPLSDSFEFTTHDAYDTTSLPSNQVRCVFADRHNDLWVGTFPTGVNFFDRSKTAFTVWQSHAEGIPHNAILKIFKDSRGLLWIGTENGLSAYNPQTKLFQHYFHDPQNPYSLRANIVVSINEDRHGNMWFGTWSGGLHRFERDSGRFYNYYPEPGNANALLNQHAWALALDHDGNLWTAHTEQGGLSRYRPETDDFETIRPEPGNANSLASPFIWTLLVDSRNRLWIGTFNGLHRLDLPSRNLHHFAAQPDVPGALNNSVIYSALEHSNGTLWFGTDGGGLNILDPATGRFSQLALAEGLPGLRVAALVEDLDGFVWAGTSNGVAQIHPQTFAIKVYHTSDGLAGNTYNRDSLFVDDDGKIYLGSTDGITIIDKTKLQPLAQPPQVALTHLRILNDEVSHRTTDSPLNSTLGSTSALHLDHRHRMFSLGFAALSYRSTFKNRFYYKLDGFDREWHLANNSQMATYTNLDPGTYVFRVKAANSNGIWNERGAELAIHIEPPLWQTWWAYCLYAIAIMAAFYSWMHFKTRHLQREQEKELAHKNKLIQLDRMKDSFLANTSHELRTPLNGIIGMTESLLNGPLQTAASEVKHSLYMVIASGQRLTSLVDDLLDFSKLSNNELKIQLRPVNISQLLDQSITILQPQLVGKTLTINNQASGKNIYALADRARIQQVFLHLIENAIKYTDRGLVEIGAATNDALVTVYVKDTGIGIPEAQQKLIFAGFNQLAEANTRTQKGTGIGLAIAAKLIQLHGGTISLKSKPGVGSTFTLTLPASRALDERDHTAAALTQRSNKTRTVLIVDDDPVNRMVLSALLKQQKLQLLEAANGPEALQLLSQHRAIDLVILDIMMPQMSGIEVCREIRKQCSRAQLPIIFLTAKREDDARDAALDAGGNAFLTKPISHADLLPCVAEQLQD